MGRPVQDSHPQGDRATAYFAALDIAVSRGDYLAASKAQHALAALGWDVRRCHPQSATAAPLSRERQAVTK
jgi:hypothetical protein